jgi:hypothetical protein
MVIFVGYASVSLDGTDGLNYIPSRFGTEYSKVKSQQDHFQLVYNILHQNYFKTCLIHSLYIQVLSLWHQIQEDGNLFETEVTQSVKLPKLFVTLGSSTM